MQKLITSDALHGLKKCPRGFIPENTISNVAAFMAGYETAIYDKGVVIHDPLVIKCGDFTEAVAKATGTSLAEQYGWRRILLDHCGGDEELAYTKFFEILEEFEAG